LGLTQAAMAARKLGCDYIWLDLLCLNQRSSGDKKLQVKNMANIYRKAGAVLIMFGGCGAAQGLDKTSPWIDRAWTLQEATLNGYGTTWGLVEWTLPGYGANLKFPTGLGHESYSLTLSRVHRTLAVFRLSELLDGVNIEEPATKVYVTKTRQRKLPANASFEERTKTIPEEEISLHLRVRCLGRHQTAVATLTAVFEIGMEDDWKGNVKIGAMWRSMWLRTSTKPQDMIFSVLHLLDVDIAVDYTRSLDDLVQELIQKTSARPAWLTIGHKIPVAASSGLVPTLATFAANSEPTYRVHGVTYPAVSLLGQSGMCSRFDIVVTTLPQQTGHRICGQSLKVEEMKKLKAQDDGDFIMGDQMQRVQLQLSSERVRITSECWFEGEMGSLVVIAGQRLGAHRSAWKGGVEADPDPYVILLEEKTTVTAGSVWTKVGAGKLKISEEIIKKIKRSHIWVGHAGEVVSCNCTEGRSKGYFVADVRRKYLRML